MDRKEAGYVEEGEGVCKGMNFNVEKRKRKKRFTNLPLRFLSK
jgi:hypothetical protein